MELLHTVQVHAAFLCCHTANYVCKVLYCANYATCRGLASFNSIVMLIPWFQLSHCYTCHTPVSYDLINLHVAMSLQVLQDSGYFTFAEVPDLKGPPAPGNSTTLL